MWIIVLVCISVIVDGSVGIISDWKVTRGSSHVARKRDVQGFYFPNGSDAGYYTGRTVVSKDFGNETEWFVQDGPNQKRLKYEHRFNLYDLGERKLIDGIPVFVRAEDGDWYKIVDPPEGFKDFVTSKLDFYYLKENSLILSTADFKPANVTDLYNTYRYPEPPKYNVSMAQRASSEEHTVVYANKTVKIVRRSVEDGFHQPINSSVGYYTGRNVTNIMQGRTVNWYKSETEGNLSIWYVVEAPGLLKNIVYEHRLNVYEPTDVGLVEEYPVFVRTDDGNWYKIMDPVTEFRQYLARLPFYLEKDNLVLGPEDFKPAELKYNKEYDILETVHKST